MVAAGHHRALRFFVFPARKPAGTLFRFSGIGGMIGSGMYTGLSGDGLCFGFSVLPSAMEQYHIPDRKGDSDMKFIGVSRVFSTENDGQYNTIGAFWDELSERYGLENLRGLGYNWTENTIEYVIGLKEGTIDRADCEAELPDTGWVTVKGKTAELDRIYGRIYEEGRLTYEIETFTEDGECEISYFRKKV